MERNPKVSYPSTKILGRLYRACSGESSGASEIQSFDRVGNSTKQIDDIIFDVEYNDPEVDREAKSLLQNWNSQILRMMDTFGVSTEGELVSGVVHKFSVHHSRLRGRKDHHALLLRLNRQTRELRSDYRDIFFSTLAEQPGSDLSVSQIEKACAWYKACKEQAESDREAGLVALHSFPWVAGDILGKVITSGLRSRNLVRTMPVQQLDEHLMMSDV